MTLFNTTKQELAQKYKGLISTAIYQHKTETSFGDIKEFQTPARPNYHVLYYFHFKFLIGLH
jgi:hypothetical protein